MNFEEVVLRVVNILNQQNIPYFVTGALAVVYYGEPRTTHDIDLVIEISNKDIDILVKLFEQEFSIDRVSIKAAIKEKSMFNAVHKDTGFKIDFWMVGDDAFYKKRFARRVHVYVLGTTMYLPTPEDVIVSKLEWFKMSEIDKHYFDALGVYRIQKGKLDVDYVDKWCTQKSTASIWKEIQAMEINKT